MAAGGCLRVGVREPLDPRAFLEADEGRVALVPLRDELLEVAGPQQPDLHRGVRLEDAVQPFVAE